MAFLLASFITIISFTSCSEDPLDKVPLDSYTDASVWTDLKLAEAFANNLYTVLPSTQHNWNDRTNRSWVLSTACDEAFNNFNDYDIWNLNSGALTPDNAGNFDVWKPTYATIQNCNIFLSRIDGVPGDEATRSRLKGEVLFEN